MFDLNQKLVDAEFLKFDKYGRPLVKLEAEGVDVSQEMIRSGLAIAYFGGTKMAPPLSMVGAPSAPEI